MSTIANATGIHDAVSWEDYQAIPAVNASMLKHDTSAKHLKAAKDGLLGRDDSRDRKFGRGFHAYLLEGPTAFEKRFLVSTLCCEIIKSKQSPRHGQPCGATGVFYRQADKTWYCRKHFPEDAIEPEDYVPATDFDYIVGVCKSILAHPAVKIIREHGGCEQTLIWERDGIFCKGRTDKMILEGNCPPTIVDVKKCTVERISQAIVEKSIADYGWDRQAYWYRDGLRRLEGIEANFIWIFAEDKPPHDVLPLFVEEAWFETGKVRTEKAFTLYRHGVETGLWPGVTDKLVSSFPPDWYYKMWAA